MSARFPFQGPRDLLSKARRDLDQLLEAVEPADGEPDELRIADLTMNVAWTLWHVTDWIASSRVPAIELLVSRKGITSMGRERTDKFQNQLCCESVDLRHCWELALRFKHFELDEWSREDAELEDAYTSGAISAILVDASSGQASFPAADIVRYLGASKLDVAPGDRATQIETGVAVDYSAGPQGSTVGLSALVAEFQRKSLHPKIQHDGIRIRLTEVYGRAYDYLDALLVRHGL